MGERRLRPRRREWDAADESLKTSAHMVLLVQRCCACVVDDASGREALPRARSMRRVREH